MTRHAVIRHGAARHGAARRPGRHLGRGQPAPQGPVDGRRRRRPAAGLQGLTSPMTPGRSPTRFQPVATDLTGTDLIMRELGGRVIDEA